MTKPNPGPAADCFRLEDDRLLTGTASFVADLRLPGMAEVAIIRSPLPHARITRINLDRARVEPGVLTAVAAHDLSRLKPLPEVSPPARPLRARPLCGDSARYVGAPVAAVVAADRYTAEDASELVEVTYEELPSVASIEAALAAGAPRLFDDWPDNRILEIPGGCSDCNGAFARRRIVKGTYRIQRLSASPLETRGCVANFRNGRLELFTSTQFPHIVRTILARVLPLAERDIRVVAPDVGGGFGAKAEVYPEEYLVSWLAIQLGRPVRFIEDRREHLISCAHARDMLFELEAAVDADGSVAAVRGKIFCDVGSGEIYPPGFPAALVALGTLTGPYRISDQDIGVTCVVTNKTPAGAYRGFGLPESAFAIERLLDRVADELRIDRLTLRRRLLIGKQDLPYTTASGAKLTSGSYVEAFERATKIGRQRMLRARRRSGVPTHVRIGLGVVNYVQGTAPTFRGTSGLWGSHDSCSIRFDPDGSVSVAVGVSSSGQGLSTMVASLAATALGINRKSVRVVMGDTDAAPYGLGGWGSRSTVVAAGAIETAAASIREKAALIAAHKLELEVSDIELDDGHFHPRGRRTPSLSWAEVAWLAYVDTPSLPSGLTPGLDAAATFEPPGIDHAPGADGKMNACAAYSNAAHAAVVAVDVETGRIEIVDYVAVNDCGRLISSEMVEALVCGGIAQGIGTALQEEVAYDTSGRPLATSFSEYLLPLPTQIPSIVVEHLETADLVLPLGVKGAGEAGVAGPAPALAAAVEDALGAMVGGQITSTPMTPAALRRLFGLAQVKLASRTPKRDRLDEASGR